MLASPRREDYNADDFCPQNRVHACDWASGAHFIVALEQHDITIRGGGRIDGNRGAFFDLPEEIRRIWYTPIRWRPGQMVFFCECTNVTVTDVEMVNYPYWCLFLHGCRNAILRGLRIINSKFVRNSDGIDLDCCSHVTVSDCVILTGDDCITLRAVNAPLKQPHRCEHITVTNCVLSSICNAIRVGVGSGEIRDALFSNLVIYDTPKAICLISSYGSGGVLIDGISFDHINLECARAFAILTNAKGRLTGPAQNPIRNVSFNHVKGSFCVGSLIQGYAPGDVGEISFNDVNLELLDYRENPTYLAYLGANPRFQATPEMGYFEWMREPPANEQALWPEGELSEFDVRRLKELFQILKAAALPPEMFRFENAVDVAMNRVKIRRGSGVFPEFPDIGIYNCSGMEFSGCSFPGGTREQDTV